MKKEVDEFTVLNLSKWKCPENCWMYGSVINEVNFGHTYCIGNFQYIGGI